MTCQQFQKLNEMARKDLALYFGEVSWKAGHSKYKSVGKACWFSTREFLVYKAQLWQLHLTAHLEDGRDFVEVTLWWFWWFGFTVNYLSWRLKRIFSLCPFCHHRTIGLQHMVTTCPGTIDLRRNLPDPNVDPRILLKAALTYPGNEKDLIAQVILVSSAVARFATAFDLSTI